MAISNGESVSAALDVGTAVRALAAQLSVGAGPRDRRGGTAKIERELIRSSGLLRLTVPTELGGSGASWPMVFGAVRNIAEADASLGQLFGFHHVIVATCRLFGSPDQWRRLLEGTARLGWFWGNALNPLDRRLVLRRTAGGLRLRGLKSFSTGATDSDMLLISALDEQTEKIVVAAVPTRRPGIDVRDDWDNIGQRLTDSGSTIFNDVELDEREILGPPGPLGSTFATLRSCIAQLTFVNVYIGIAHGALASAKPYTRTRTRIWPGSGVEHAFEDPYVLEHFGSMWAQLVAAVAAADRAAELLEAAWQMQDELTSEKRGEVALMIAAAKVVASRAVLDISARVFEATGAGATATAFDLDRFWRNARTLTLHDRLDYKVRELGDWVLNDRIPVPSFYS
jgi:alkylation response protein AidB-like acyl-CoA dehydrogenase